VIFRGLAFGVDKHEQCVLVSTRTREIEGRIILAGKKGKRPMHNGNASVIYSTGWSPAQDNGADQTDNCKYTHKTMEHWGGPNEISHPHWKTKLITMLQLHSASYIKKCPFYAFSEITFHVVCNIAVCECKRSEKFQRSKLTNQIWNMSNMSGQSEQIGSWKGGV